MSVRNTLFIQFTTVFTLFLTHNPTVNMLVDFQHDYILKQRLLFMVRPAGTAEDVNISVPSIADFSED